MTKIHQFNNEEFQPGIFVVDPAGCGCTDCILGYATPADELQDDQLAAAIGVGLKLIDRRNSHEKLASAAPIFRPVDPEWVRLILATRK